LIIQAFSRVEKAVENVDNYLEYFYFKRLCNRFFITSEAACTSNLRLFVTILPAFQHEFGIEQKG
jgi:hypothetical protein